MCEHKALCKLPCFVFRQPPEYDGIHHGLIFYNDLVVSTCMDALDCARARCTSCGTAVMPWDKRDRVRQHG